MLRRRLPLLRAFVGGCLSGAVLISLWRADAGNRGPQRSEASERSDAADSRRAPNRTSGASRTVSAATSEEANEAALVKQAGATADEHKGDRDGAPPSAEEAALASAAETSASLVDVLSRLEAEYRRQLAAAASREPPPNRPEATAPVSAGAAAAAEPSTPPSPAEQVNEAPRELAPREAPAVAVAAAAAAARNVRQAEDLPADITANVDGASTPREEPRAPVTYVGDVHQNIYMGNVHQGDVYQLQQLAILQQQMAMLQYMQLLSLTSRAPRLAPRVHAAPRARTRHISAFPTSLTNTDNPWGFDFPPTVLVR